MTPCLGCDADTTLRERLVYDRSLPGLCAPSIDSGYCADCRVHCAICAGWMAGEPEMLDGRGNRVHCACEVGIVLESLPSMSVCKPAIRQTLWERGLERGHL